MNKAPLPPGTTVLHLDTGREWRGGQNQAFLLARGLHDRGVEQVFVTPPDAPLAERLSEVGLELRALPMRGDWDLHAPRRLRAIVDEAGANLIHAHDAHAHALTRAALRGCPGVRLVVSRRVDFAIKRNPFSRRKYLDPRVHYLAISNGVREVLVAGGVAPERIRVVPSGVDPARFDFDTPPTLLRDEYGLSAETPIVGTVGSLVDHKGHRYLVEAAPRVLERRTDAHFFVVGEGPLRADLESRIATLGLSEQFHLPGHREDVGRFVAGFDVFALPSHLEGLSTSVIDALLFARPVVASDTGGVPDLIRHEETGLLVPPRDSDALAGGIVRLLDDRALARRLGENGRRHALAGFTAQALVENTLDAYRAILQDGPHV